MTELINPKCTSDIRWDVYIVWRNPNANPQTHDSLPHAKVVQAKGNTILEVAKVATDYVKKVENGFVAQIILVK